MGRGSHMTSKDLEYYRERARTEHALANASMGTTAEIHLTLAKQYEQLIAKAETVATRRGTIRMVHDAD